MERETPLSLSGAPEPTPELPVEADALLCFVREIPLNCHVGFAIVDLKSSFQVHFSRLAAMDHPGQGPGAAGWFVEDELAVLKSISVHCVGGFYPGFAV